jgi:2-dehydro-3-deoxygluconokinase
MASGLNVPDPSGKALDFLSLGALVHRLDPGIIPFRRAKSLDIHVSGGEYNVAANLSACFGLRTAVATAMVKYPIGELIACEVQAMGAAAY